MDWKSHIEGLLSAGATVDQLASGMGVTPNAVREIRAGRTRSPRADAAFRLAAMLPSQFLTAGSDHLAMATLVDMRMTKRALRDRLALFTDGHLAKVLGVPVEQVEAWAEDESVPALPSVLQVLGIKEVLLHPKAPEDPDAGRIIPVEAA